MKMKYYTIINVIILIISWAQLSFSITVLENKKGIQQKNITVNEDSKSVDNHEIEIEIKNEKENENETLIENKNEFPSINVNKKDNLFLEINKQIDDVKNLTM